MDIYRDFAYCRLAADAGAGVATVSLDELGRLPSNAELAAGKFWMTFESTLALGQFEIVRLVSKSAETGPGTAVLERAQQGTSSYGYAAGTVLKHALTAEMLRDLVALAQASTGYKRYVDLGNPPTIAGTSSVDSEPAVLRGLAAGQAGGATVVAGALITRGLEAAAAGLSTAGVTTLDITQQQTQAAEVFGNEMYGA